MHRRGVFRLVLLLLVAIGVAGMHTLGHPTIHSHGGGHGASTRVGYEQMIDAAHLAAVSVANVDLQGSVVPLNPLEVCLAVLVAGLVLLVAAIVVARLRRGVPDGHLRAALAVAGRGPPRRASAGLLLARLSVMRN